MKNENWQRFLNFCVVNNGIINIITFLVVTVMITVSTFCFNNSYFDTKWHWIVSFIGCGIMWFVSLCIVEVDNTESRK
jgi:hypothetical protein